MPRISGSLANRSGLQRKLAETVRYRTYIDNLGVKALIQRKRAATPGPTHR